MYLSYLPLNANIIFVILVHEYSSSCTKDKWAGVNLIISERTTRIIDNASSIKFENKYYVPVNNETGEVVSYMKKTECIVILTYNAELWCKIENNFYILVEIEDRDTTMKKEIDNDKPIERKTVIPPKSHPWRKNMMLR